MGMGSHVEAGSSKESQSRARALVFQSMLLALALCALKVVAGLAAHSLALLASALDSLMDLLSSGLNYASLVFSQKPADADHLYGHGKIEAVAGTFQGIVIAASGVALLVESVRRIILGEPVDATAFGIAVMVVSMVLSGLHGARLRRAAAKSGSSILQAEGLHFSMDVLANLGVLFALVVIRFGGSPRWDIVISLIVAGYVVTEALGLLIASINQLLDRRLSDKVHAEIRDLIESHHPRIIGHHNLRTRQSGEMIFIDFHIEISGVEQFEAAHDIAESLISKIKSRMPNADVTVHCDPEREIYSP